MQFKTLPVVITLVLTLLAVLPSSYIGLSRVHAFNQDVSIFTTSLPFGPESDQIIFQYYGDISTMFNAFTAGGSGGGIDITDWPLFPADSGITNQPGSLCDPFLHPDFYCSSPGVQFGLYQLDINHEKPFLGVNQLQPRTTSPVSVSLSAPSPGCSAGFGSVTVQLQNQESLTSDELFAINSMTLTQVLSGGVLSGSTTLSGTGGTGVYSFPCVVAGNYLLSNSAYANCASNLITPCEIFLGSATTNKAVFHSNWNSASNKQYTQAGIYVRQAIRHLLDKPQFILGQTLLGQAQCTDIYAAQPQGFPNGYCSQVNRVGNKLPADVLSAECPALRSVDPALGCNPIDAYLLNATAIGQTNVWWSTGPLADNGYPSKQDIRAACDLFVLAGFAVTPTGSTCIDVANAAQGTTPPCTPPAGQTACTSNYPHNTLPTGQQIIFYDRTHLPRRAFGQITIDGLNFLFGTAQNGNFEGSGTNLGTCAVNHGYKSPPPGCVPHYYGFTEISGIIFADGVDANTWSLYTGGESFSINPDNEYSTFSSAFASNYCGGVASTVIINYDVVCDPKLDAYTNAGEFADTFNHAVNIFQNATYVSTEGVSTNPVFNQLQRFVALNSLNFGNTPSSEASLVNGDGTGWEAGTSGAFSTLLNAHCNPNYTPVSSAFACGHSPGSGCGGFSCNVGGGSTLRRGESQLTVTFSPYQATSPGEFDLIHMIWDSMLLLNPNAGGPNLQLSNYMVMSHASFFNPSDLSFSPGLGSVVGTTTQIWRLRPDLSFHDGTAVTADDVCFSILTYRDMPSALLQSSVFNVASCSALNESTVQVKLGLKGPFYDNQIGLVPILPHHVWAAACNWPVGTPEPSSAVLAASQCANPNDDPMLPLQGQTTGRMIGSGPFMCLGSAVSSVPGVPGGSCVITAIGTAGGSFTDQGYNLLLTAFPQYHRGPVAQEGSKYQKFSWADKFDTGLVTIADIADAALHNKHYDPYWASPLYSSSPATCSTTGGPGTGNLQCVDIGDISTIALYKGIGATDPIPLSSYVALDPHIDRFGSGVPVTSGGFYYLGTTARTPSSLAGTIDVPSPGTITSVTGKSGGQTGTCTFTASPSPGRVDYTCTFSPALASGVEVSVTITGTLPISGSASTTIITKIP